MTMQLYGSYTSPFVRHIRIVLLQTGLACEFIETDMVSSAKISPVKKVPFLKDGEVALSDSAAILRYLREKAGQLFLPTAKTLDLYCLVNTVMDSTVNIFYLQRDGLELTASPYLQRQQSRVDDGLQYLNAQNLDSLKTDLDVLLRLQCYLYWGLYRKRFSLDHLPSLQRLLNKANEDPIFVSTAPPDAS